MNNNLAKSFSIDFESEIDGQRYQGTFTTKKLTVGDLSKMGVRKVQLSGGYQCRPESAKGISPEIDNINEMIAHCEIALIQKPDWFVPTDLVDNALLFKVYEEVASFEASFRSKGKQNSARLTEVPSSQESPREGGLPDGIEAVVVQKIPKIAQVS